MAKNMGEKKTVVEDPGTSEAGLVLRTECPFCGCFVDITINQDHRGTPLRERCLCEIAVDVMCGKCGGGLTIPIAIGLFRKVKAAGLVS